MSALAREHEAINLSQGFPDFEIDQNLKDLINKYVQQGYNQYAPMTGVESLRIAIAKKKKLLYDVDLNYEDEITITNGATEALYSSIAAFISHGDEVIIFEPAYDSYAPAINVNGGIVIPIELKLPEFTIDWNEVSSKISTKTRMIIINSPHNPTGSILRQKDLNALSEITKDSNILVLSDEVYQHLIYDGNRHHSILEDEMLYQRSIVTMSFGKTFHATGWRVGYAIAPPNLSTEIRKVHQYNTFSINRPLQHAIAEYLSQPERYLSLPGFYQNKRDFFQKAIAHSAFDLLPSFGTYFMLASFKNVSPLSDQEFARWMTKEKKVAVIPMSSFYSQKTDNKLIRFCFAKKEETLSEAAQRIMSIS